MTAFWLLGRLGCIPESFVFVFHAKRSPSCHVGALQKIHELIQDPKNCEWMNFQMPYCCYVSLDPFNATYSGTLVVCHSHPPLKVKFLFFSIFVRVIISFDPKYPYNQCKSYFLQNINKNIYLVLSSQILRTPKERVSQNLTPEFMLKVLLQEILIFHLFVCSTRIFFHPCGLRASIT